MRILAVESSCDELALALAENDKIVANLVSSQIKDHAPFGGVVPELAARLHVENLAPLLSALIKIAPFPLKTIDYVAYTATPGLIGSLTVGKILAETIALYYNKPLLPLNHLSGHIFGATINQQFAFPILALIVSGGHTQIEYLRSPSESEIIGQTLDDAIGECYDKVAGVLGFAYPGGAKLDQLAQQGKLGRYRLPSPKTDDSYDFSYSGLKTASVGLINRVKKNKEILDLPDFCATFQAAATKNLKTKLERAIKQYSPQTLLIAGGVSANSNIRRFVQELGTKYHVPYTLIPDLEYCTDNAAMIAKYAYEYLKHEAKAQH